MRNLIGILALALSVMPSAMFAQVSNNNEDGVYKTERHNHRAFRQGEVIVKFKTGSAMGNMARSSSRVSAVSSMSRVMSEIGATAIEPLMPLTGELKQNAARSAKGFNGKDVEIKDMSTLYTVRFDETKQQDVYAVVDKLKTIDDVEFVEPNYLVYTTATGDGDLYNKDPLYNNNGHWGITGINIYDLWNTPKITTKRPVIAILDTGIDITHPDLAANIWTNKLENEGAEDRDDDANGFKDDIHGWDFVNNSPRIRDNNGHGTHCAGIAAAVGGNGIGAAGVNPDAWIMPVTVMQSDGTGDVATIIKGIDYAVANGADVISMSFGGYSNSMAEEQALAHAYATAILVAAAGNDGLCMNHAHPERGQMAPAPMFPAAYTFVLGVQSSQSSGALASFSNYDDNGAFYSGYGEDKLYNYEITAPGVKIISTFPNGQYKELSGTSMACPAVAGAISRLMQCKELGSKEELFGDLINSKTANGNLDIYKAYQMSDANRKPTLSLITYNMDDAAGDGDGRADAGETIDIYPVIRNAWGSAKNIRVSIELAETEDPEIVQIINGTADFGSDLSSYAKATSANALRIKINDNCADGRHICLVLKATCDNITEEVKQDLMIKAENGVEIGGVIGDDMTLHEGVHYIVTQTIAVPQGVTLTIEPGAVLKFKDGTAFNCEGTLIAAGTPEKMIIFTSADGDLGKYGPLKFNNNTVKYALIENRTLNSGTEYYGLIYSGTLDNCIIKDCYLTHPFNSYVIGGMPNILNSNITNIEARIGFDRGIRFTNCNVVGNLTTADYIEYYLNLNEFKSSNILGNAFGDYIASVGYNWPNVSVLRQEEQNYLGSSKNSILRNYIMDMNHPIYSNGYGAVDLDYVAKTPNPEAHGIVWKVVVNGKDALDEFEELAPLGVGKHKFEVYFNRPMNKAVTPTISMGVRPPYASISIAEEGENSGWNEAGDIYTAYLTINGKTNADGLNRIRVYGAEDKEYFEIPEEKYRFNVMVQKAGSMSTGLMAEAGLGKVSLTWETAEEDFADLMGYNVYRYEDDPEKATQINETLVDATETEFVDYDVVPGTTYYYMVKEMGTDLQQHDVSNVVAATPLTAQKGDANGSMSVDVADVVTEVNYLTNQNPQPFIFEAADVNSDNAVNILDVVGTVNIIMTPEAGTSSVDNTATFTVEDGILYVDATTPLGGVQVSVAAPSGTEFETMEGLNGMEHAGSWMNENEYMLLAYSMSGKTIGIGKQPLLRIGDAEVKSIVASDARGKNVLAVNGATTSIDELPFGIDNFKNAEMRYYDLSGRMINSKAAQKSGMYIQSLFINGRCVKSYKVMK